MIKRDYYYLIIVILTSLVFGACQKEHSYRIGISQCSDDDWRQKMNAEVEREMLFHPEATVEIRSADDNNEKQISDIRYFIDNDFDIIIAAPNEAEALTPIISEAYDKGIPVLLFDRRIKGDKFTAWLGADNEDIGRMAARYVRQLVGTSAPVMEIGGRHASTPAQGRHVGFNSLDLNIVAEADGNWNYEDALHIADSLLELHPDTRAIFAHNDRMVIAASDAAGKRGLSPYIIGVDGAPNIGIKAVADSIIYATFFYPTEGATIVNTALAILNDEPYERMKSFPASSAIDKTNVDLVIQRDQIINGEVTRLHRLKTQMDEYWQEHSSQTVALYWLIAAAVLLSLTIFLLLRTYWQHKRHQDALARQNKLLQEERDKQKDLMEQLAEATASKLAFFTNVSHDLRTPLTLIAEPVGQLSRASNLTERQKALVQIANKNVHILQRLINQILDFRKFEAGALKLHTAEADMKALVEGWAEAFYPLALRRDIKLTTSFEGDDFNMAIDPEKFERIYYNIVSNAFKYTPDNGSIEIKAICDGKEFTLRVSDTGCGIPESDLPVVFDRFFRVEHVRPNGSGIGLALAKAFAELHGGSISVESEEGKGSVFTVTVPVTHVDNPIDSSEGNRITSDIVNIELSKIDFPHEEENKHSKVSQRPVILVIDDNHDIIAMMTEMLSEEYEVISASNGSEGVRAAAKYVPDLVICDVMMPEMDGFECCRIIKDEVSTSHIPVLLLTACALDEQRASGYEMGADGYLSKPFNAKVLMSRIRNLITNRKRILNLDAPSNGLTRETEIKKEKKVTIEGTPDLDNEFYNRFLALVNERIGDSELNVDALAGELGLGRSQFYRKIKSLTNYSPVELLRRIRLSRARTLLTRTEQSVSEISYAVGFSTPAYFTKCYREAFGETPSELRSRLKGG